MNREINFYDAQQASGFIIPQQLRIETEVFQTRYPSFEFGELMFVNTDGDMWDIGTVFFSGDIAGKAEFLAGAGFDMPYASVARTQFLQQNHFAGIGYEWFLQELQRAAKEGRNLPNEKAMAAGKVAQRFKYGIAIRGSTEKGFVGLINNPSVPTANVPADGTGSSALWANKTPDQIARDFNLGLSDVINNTAETSIPDTVLLPSSRLQAISTKRIGDTADYTLLRFLRENNLITAQSGRPLTIRGSRELETAGAGGTARMVTYDNSREVVQFHLPGDHTFLPPWQKSSMTWEVAGIMNIGGTEIRLPKAMSYRDGI